jgi:myosin heavy subunit
LTRDNGELSTELRLCHDKLDQNARRCGELLRENHKLRADGDAIKIQAEIDSSALAACKVTETKLLQTLQDLTSEMKVRTGRLRDLEVSRNAAVEETLVLKGDVRQQNQLINNLKATLTSSKFQATELFDLATSHDTEIDDLRQVKESLQADISQLNEHVATLTEERARVYETLTDLKSYNADLEVEVQQLRECLARFNTNPNAPCVSLSVLQNELDVKAKLWMDIALIRRDMRGDHQDVLPIIARGAPRPRPADDDDDDADDLGVLPGNMRQVAMSISLDEAIALANGEATSSSDPLCDFAFQQQCRLRLIHDDNVPQESKDANIAVIAAEFDQEMVYMADVFQKVLRR